VESFPLFLCGIYKFDVFLVLFCRIVESFPLFLCGIYKSDVSILNFKVLSGEYFYI
jgi:hypothetical protein